MLCLQLVVKASWSHSIYRKRIDAQVATLITSISQAIRRHQLLELELRPRLRSLNDMVAGGEHVLTIAVVRGPPIVITSAPALGRVPSVASATTSIGAPVADRLSVILSSLKDRTPLHEITTILVNFGVANLVVSVSSTGRRVVDGHTSVALLRPLSGRLDSLAAGRDYVSTTISCHGVIRAPIEGTYLINGTRLSDEVRGRLMSMRHISPAFA